MKKDNIKKAKVIKFKSKQEKEKEKKEKELISAIIKTVEHIK